jgi:hypothetical protein
MALMDMRNNAIIKQAQERRALKQVAQENFDAAEKEAKEKSRKMRMRDISNIYGIADAQRSASFGISSAALSSRPDFNRQQELATLREMSALKDRDIQNQMGLTFHRADDLLRNGNVSEDERVKINHQVNTELIKLDGELKEHRLTSQKEILLAERAAAEERKKMAQEFSAIQASAFEAQTGRNSMTLATQASKNIADAFDTFKDFDIRMARAAESAARIAEAMKLGSAAFESGMSALGFRSQATREALRDPDDLGGRARRRETFGAALDIVNRAQEFRGQAALAGSLANNPFLDTENFAAFEQLDNFDAVSRRFRGIGAGIGDMGAGGAGILAQAQLNALPDIGTLTAIAQMGGARGAQARGALGTVAGLNRTLAADQERELQKTLAKSAILEKTILPDAQAQLDLIQKDLDAKRLSPKAALDAFLATTEELGDEITPEMLKMRVQALKDRATIEEKNRKELINAVKNIKQEVLVNIYGDGANGTMNGRPLQQQTRSTR